MQGYISFILQATSHPQCRLHFIHPLVTSTRSSIEIQMPVLYRRLSTGYARFSLSLPPSPLTYCNKVLVSNFWSAGSTSLLLIISTGKKGTTTRQLVVPVLGHPPHHVTSACGINYTCRYIQYMYI
jgi:hypothetical protein